MNFSNMCLRTIKGFTFIGKESGTWTIWDNANRNFLTWERAKGKFNLTFLVESDWEELTSMVARH